VHSHGPEAVAAEIKRIVGDNKTYLTFDIDCLDPSFAPGTGTPVCGGLSSNQALEIIRGLAGIDLIGMDLVEVAPAYDVGEITALAGATLALEFLCLYAFNRPKAV
jgi:agmatinase